MRVLCLHPEASSALQLSQELHQLEERLWKKHGIELVFVDGPLLDVQLGAAVGDEDGGLRAIVDEDPTSDSAGGGDGGDRVSRRWYVAEEKAARGTPPSTATAGAAALQYAGLDASLLHLSQIWTRGGANLSTHVGDCLPFQGVLGVGQGASVAGLLPLLNYPANAEDAEEGANGGLAPPALFQGLRFVVLVEGEEILSRRADEGEEDEAEHDVYVGPEGIRSLHVITENSDNDDVNGSDAARKRNSGETLAKHYGPNAEIHRARARHAQPCTPSASNAIGKFLLAQKKALHADANSMEILALQNQLATVEQLATVTIAREIQQNPPKALMAVIGPAAMLQADAAAAGPEEAGETPPDDPGAGGGGAERVRVDKAVGAWQGARRRGFGEEGGGAPCPGEFLLREEAR